MNRRTFLAPIMALAMVTAPLLVAPAPAQAQTPTGLVTGIYQALPGGAFTGTLTVTSFQVINGVLNAVGTVTGTLNLGTLTRTITNQAITIPVTNLTGTCTILTLHTGTINLNVLGLNVHLAPIDLVITANPAQGLLGQLLCAVANLLNGGGPLGGLLDQLTGLLNQILGAL